MEVGNRKNNEGLSYYPLSATHDIVIFGHMVVDSSHHSIQGRVTGDEPNPVSFRTEAFRGGTLFPRNSKPWGELHYALSGVCEMEVAGQLYLSPPSYGIWIPPHTEHEAWNRKDMLFVATYVEQSLCRDLPAGVCTLALSPLLKAIHADFAARGVTIPGTVEDLRLAMVLVDQIRLAPAYDSYLPFSQDPLVKPIMDIVQNAPGDRRSLAEWARLAGVTERTLSRHWRQSLGMSYNEWRQRLRLLASLPRLDAGEAVQDVALSLGFNDASAFIVMFRRLTGRSPSQIKGFDKNL